MSSLFYELSVIAAASVSIPKGKPHLPPDSLCSSLNSASVCYPGCLKVTASVLGLGSCEVLYVPFRSRVFVSYSPWLSCVQTPLALKLHVLEAHLPGSGVPKVELGPLLGEKSTIVIILLLVGSHLGVWFLTSSCPLTLLVVDLSLYLQLWILLDGGSMNSCRSGFGGRR